ncbi:MAG: tRNA lysidine(34) synthetase TilS [Pseudomonadota bacterium]|nr:tRNA lysidine(34) synthetase TilS [Pseudomonadota bacterium]
MARPAPGATSPDPLGEGFVVVVAAVEDALDAFLPGRARIAVAISGGVDSMVLLDALAQVAKERPIELSAVHVNHGLSAAADDWARFCTERCASLGIPLSVRRVRITRAPGKSLEALARAARYEQFMACQVDAVALAHHADDQAETVLLQMLRGAGPRGLSAMPAFRRGTPALLRPLLSLTRKTIAAYAASRGLAWIEDESNRDTKHRRNFLRQEISPRLAARFAGYPATLVRVASHQAEGGALLEELAALDAEGAVDAGGLDRAHLAGLPDARAANLLRWFLRREGLRPPSRARLADLLRQLRSASADAHTRIAHDGAELGCHRGRVVVHAPAAAPFAIAWTGDPEVLLPGGTLVFEAVAGEGIADAKLALASVTVRSREGGERIRLAANRPRHAVKKLLQQASIPVWQRQALPLVWCGDALAAIPGIGVDVAFQAASDEKGWRLVWRPTP